MTRESIASLLLGAFFVGMAVGMLVDFSTRSRPTPCRPNARLIVDTSTCLIVTETLVECRMVCQEGRE